MGRGRYPRSFRWPKIMKTPGRNQNKMNALAMKPQAHSMSPWLFLSSLAKRFRGDRTRFRWLQNSLPPSFWRSSGPTIGALTGPATSYGSVMLQLHPTSRGSSGQSQHAHQSELCPGIQCPAAAELGQPGCGCPSLGVLWLGVFLPTHFVLCKCFPVAAPSKGLKLPIELA